MQRHPNDFYSTRMQSLGTVISTFVWEDGNIAPPELLQWFI